MCVKYTVCHHFFLTICHNSTLYFLTCWSHNRLFKKERWTSFLSPSSLRFLIINDVMPTSWRLNQNGWWRPTPPSDDCYQLRQSRHTVVIWFCCPLVLCCFRVLTSFVFYLFSHFNYWQFLFSVSTFFTLILELRMNIYYYNYLHDSEPVTERLHYPPASIK